MAERVLGKNSNVNTFTSNDLLDVEQVDRGRENSVEILFVCENRNNRRRNDRSNYLLFKALEQVKVVVDQPRGAGHSVLLTAGTPSSSNGLVWE